MPPNLPNNPWGEIQRVIGLADTWPAYLRFKFWCSNLTEFRDRIDIAAFGFLNGCEPNLLIRALRFCNHSAGVDYFRWIHYWYVIWSRLDGEGEEARDRAYAYNIPLRRVTNLNGFWDDDNPYGRRDPLVPGQPPRNPRGPLIPDNRLDAQRRGFHCFVDNEGNLIDIYDYDEDDWNRDFVPDMEPGDYMNVGARNQ